MRFVIIVMFAALTASPVALAQNGPGGDGTAPQNRGSTGWTGAHPKIGDVAMDKKGKPVNATTGQQAKVNDQQEAKGQPVVASGEDLKGPPQQFPPSKTPE
jgi:hypothetical protein